MRARQRPSCLGTDGEEVLDDAVAVGRKPGTDCTAPPGEWRYRDAPNGLTGADAICQSLAAAVGFANRTWRAYLSTQNPTVHARDRIGKGPWFNAHGTLIAQDLAALHTANANGIAPMNNINAQNGLDEQGKPVPNNVNAPPGGQQFPNSQHDILTGSRIDGTLMIDGTSMVGQTCSDWTGKGAARAGHFDLLPTGTGYPQSWNSAHTSLDCSTLQQLMKTRCAGRFYCFAAD